MVVTNFQAPLRERKRLAAMKRVQREAVRRFLAEGFDQVRVEEIAAASDVSAMSVYRWFGSKEALVLWDEFDPPILAGIAERLREQAPLAAVRDALVALLAEVYDRERELALDRARLIFREPALTAAAEQNTRSLREACSELFRAHAGLSPFQARVAAAVAATLLTASVEEWQRQDGQRPLGDCVQATFAALGAAS